MLKHISKWYNNLSYNKKIALLTTYVLSSVVGIGFAGKLTFDIETEAIKDYNSKKGILNEYSNIENQIYKLENNLRKIKNKNKKSSKVDISDILISSEAKTDLEKYNTYIANQNSLYTSHENAFKNAINELKTKQDSIKKTIQYKKANQAFIKQKDGPHKYYFMFGLFTTLITNAFAIYKIGLYKQRKKRERK